MAARDHGGRHTGREGRREVLVVLREATPEAAVATRGHTVHSASDRVLAVEVDPADMGRLEREPAVRWAGTDPPGDLLEELEPGERLFVEGWVRRRSPRGARSGEGLDWHAPGRLPPDPPPRAGGASPGPG